MNSSLLTVCRRAPRTAAIVFAAGSLLLSVAEAHAQPAERWLAHDLSRPRPTVVTPGKPAGPAAAPSDAVVLFDGGDLSKWRDAEGGPARWKVQDGAIVSAPNTGYLFTADKFGDVQLHVEWSAPTPARGKSQGRGNSGVFLMGLYEVQVLDSFENETYADGQAAAAYGQYPPLANACLPPGEWQHYDIVFRRPRFRDDGTVAQPARLTVLHNGVLVQDHIELWGPTTWLQNLPYTRHEDRLPLSLQDHGNPVRFRNIWLRELRETPDAGPPASEPRPVAELTGEQRRAVAGKYGSPLGEFGEITLEGQQLRLEMKTGQRIELVPRSPSEFDLRWTAAKLVFRLRDDGQAAGFTLHIGGDTIPISRRGGS